MTTSLQREYDENGYVIVRNAIDPDLARETAEHVHWLVARNPGVRPEKFGHNMLVTDPFMHRLVGDDRLVDIVEQFIGSNVAMWAAHYIAKPPMHGQRVLWHQDGSYWPLEPMEVTTIWLAATASTRGERLYARLARHARHRLLSRKEMIDVKDGKNVLDPASIHRRSMTRAWSIWSCSPAMSRFIIRKSSTARKPIRLTTGASINPAIHSNIHPRQTRTDTPSWCAVCRTSATTTNTRNARSTIPNSICPSAVRKNGCRREHRCHAQSKYPLYPFA